MIPSVRWAIRLDTHTENVPSSFGCLVCVHDNGLTTYVCLVPQYSYKIVIAAVRGAASDI